MKIVLTRFDAHLMNKYQKIWDVQDHLFPELLFFGAESFEGEDDDNNKL